MIEITTIAICVLIGLKTISWFIGGLYRNRCFLCGRLRLARHTRLNDSIYFAGDYMCNPDCLTRSFLNGKLKPNGDVEYDYGER